MILTVVLTGVLVVIGMAAIAAIALKVVKRAAERARDDLMQGLRAYFEAPDDQTPSEFAKLTDGIAGIVARKIAMEFKTTFMGMQSGDSRLEKAVQADMIKDAAVGGSPLLAAIASAFPSAFKRMSKNPAALPFIASALEKMKLGGGSGGGDRGGNGGGRSFADRLKDY